MFLKNYRFHYDYLCIVIYNIHQKTAKSLLFEFKLVIVTLYLTYPILGNYLLYHIILD